MWRDGTAQRGDPLAACAEKSLKINGLERVAGIKIAY
jgi:hypothetical protein